MHENDENMLFWSQFKFGITFHMQFLELNIFSYFIYDFGPPKKIDIKTKKNLISTLLCYKSIINCFLCVCVKTEAKKIIT